MCSEIESAWPQKFIICSIFTIISYLLYIFKEEMEWLILITRFFIGILLGAGAILPGISSGVICVILGIYDKIIDSITQLFKNFKSNLAPI